MCSGILSVLPARGQRDDGVCSREHHPPEARAGPLRPPRPRGQPDLVGRRGRRLLRRARRVPGRHRLHVGSGAAARGGRGTARRRHGRRVLEIGAGSGQCARWLAAAGGQVVATDLSAGMVRSGPRHRRGSCPRGARAVRPVRRPRAALSRRGLRHGLHGIRRRALRRDSDVVMAEAARVLRPGGRFVFSTTHPMRWAFADDPGPRGSRCGTPTSTARPTSSRTDAARATYVEHHRTLGDRVREIAPRASSRRPRRAGVARGP